MDKLMIALYGSLLVLGLIVVSFLWNSVQVVIGGLSLAGF